MTGYPFMNTVYPAPQAPMPITSTAVNLPRMEIPKVSGIDSANSFVMAPNSSAILMDMNKPLIYVVVTDASGYKTVTPFTISELKQEPPVTVSDLDSRFEAVNKRLDELEERMKYNVQPNSKSSWSSKPNNSEPGSGNTNSQGRQ